MCKKMTTRNRTRTVLTLAVILGVFTAFSESLQAGVLVYEPFDYPDGWLTGQGGALGTTGTWTALDTHNGDWRIHQEGDSSDIVVDPGPPIARNMFDGTVANLVTSGGYVGLPGPLDVGHGEEEDFEIGRHQDASIGLDPSVTATFQSGTTTWFSFVSVRGWDRNEQGGQLMIGTDTTPAESRAVTMSNEGSGIGGGNGPPRNNRTDIFPQYFSEGLLNNALGTGGTGFNDLPELPDETHTMPWDEFTPGGDFGPANIVVGKIEWDADTGGEDIISVVRFLEADTLSEAAFDALIALKPDLSSANWASNKPNLDQSQFDTLNFSGTKYFIDEIRIGTTFGDVVEVAPATVVPLGYWKLDETSGAIAQDSSGNGYDGILSADPDPAPLWTTDPERGNVLEFVPGLDYVDCGPGVSAGQNLTVALWIKPADKELMRPISCFDGGDYSVNPGWYLMLRHDDWDGQVPPNLWFRITGGVDPETPEDAWNSGDVWINECWAPGEWVHMAFTFDEDTDTLSGYINGELAGVTIVPESRSVASETNPLIMGHGGGEEYQGLMDEVCIYDVALTDAEIWGFVYPIAITVPNGDFEEIYKPGSDTITADLGGGWTQGVGPDAPMDDGIATYSDGTTGDWVDIPGWIGADTQGWIDAGGTYDRNTDFPNRQGSIARQSSTPDGLYYYLSNGGQWGNPAGGLIVSDAPLGNVEDGTYTLSMVANGGATPVVLELLADGVALTPSSSVDPVLSDEWQEFSRTYDAASLGGHIGESLTIRLGVGRGASGAQSHFDAVSLSYVPESAAPTMVPITIDNPGFEDPVLVEDDWTWLDVPGWTWVGGEGPGIWHVTSADFDPVVAPEGQNVLYTENAVGDAGGVAQVLTDTFAANMEYTLTVEVGNSYYYYNAGYSVQFLAGGVVIAEDNDTLWPEYYKWATSTVEYTYDPADAALVGQPLEIRLLNLALDKDSPPAGDSVGVEFDNVTLFYSSDE